jgi:NAD(P)-dependent dehydrogenase (short-subunit alcohol dehydrogenase family)
MNAPARDLTGRVCVVSGGTSGIGQATATGLARLGATVLVLGRDVKKGEVAAAQISAQAGNPSVDFVPTDLGSPARLRECAQEIRSRHPAVHVLINNAHVYHAHRVTTDDGLEAMFAVNYLSQFRLSHLLLDALKAGAPSRIVNVSDDWGLVRRAGVDFEDLQAEKDYAPVRQHNRAKLAVFYFTHELAKRLEGTGVTVNCLYPGHVDTGLKGDVPWFTHVVYPAFKRLGVLKTPEEGAETPVYLASSPEVEDVTGRHFANKKAVDPSHIHYDEAVSRRLWDVSVQLAGLQ